MKPGGRKEKMAQVKNAKQSRWAKKDCVMLVMLCLISKKH
jgi:hypothetical protein